MTGSDKVSVGDDVALTFSAPNWAYGSTAYSVSSIWGKYTYSVQPGDNTVTSGFGGTSDSAQYEGKWAILNWYWINESDFFGTGLDGARGHLSYCDAHSTDTRYVEDSVIDNGEYYRAFRYSVEVSEADEAKLADYGLSVEKGYSRYKTHAGTFYDVNDSLTITGKAAKAGTVEVAVKVYVPLVRGFGGAMFPNAHMQATPLCLPITRTVTITIG